MVQIRERAPHKKLTPCCHLGILSVMRAEPLEVCAQGFGAGGDKKEEGNISWKGDYVFSTILPSTSWLSSAPLLQFFVWGCCEMHPIWVSPTVAAVWGAYLSKPTILLQQIQVMDALVPVPQDLEEMLLALIWVLGEAPWKRQCPG